jgi:hypothetical protein
MTETVHHPLSGSLTYTAAMLVAPILAVALAATPALATQPVADSRYAGQTSQGDRYRLEFRVAPDARRVERVLAQFRTPACTHSPRGTQGNLRIAGAAIDGDRFTARGKETARLAPAGKFEGGKQIERYTLAGHFPDAERATGTLKITVEIRDKAGDEVDRCTTAKRVRWSADRLGVSADG